MKKIVYLFAALMLLVGCSKQPEQVDGECDDPTEWGKIDLNEMEKNGEWQGPQ